MISTKEIGLGLTATVGTFGTETYSMKKATTTATSLNMRNH